MSRVHRAAWVLPIDAPPIHNGWVEVDNGRIVAVGAADARGASREPRVASREARVAILPALVNAHTHLELSWMRGRVPPGDAMPDWAARLIAERQQGDSIQQRSTAGSDFRRDAIVGAIAEARASGTGLVGDVTNTLEAWGPLADSRLSATVFFELLGFRAADPAALVESAKGRLADVPSSNRLRWAIAPHAPYSVSPSLFRAIAGAAAGRPLSVHLGESREEIQFLRDGHGPWRDLLERIGAWSPDWVAPGCGSVEYMQRLGLLSDRLIAVHGVQFDDDDLRQLASCDATVVACPRSNRWTGAGVPPISSFYRSGVRVAFGTDSLASVDDLNLFSEMVAVRRLCPDIPASQILKSATLEGAVALGVGKEVGSISPGKRAELLAVRIPAEAATPKDVEEYLVGGIEPADITWLEAE
jgi:cytosine/adenosine deaminase-related metal-dependent hydrolase